MDYKVRQGLPSMAGLQSELAHHEMGLKLSISSSIISGSNWGNLKHIELQPNLPVCKKKSKIKLFTGVLRNRFF